MTSSPSASVASAVTAPVAAADLNPGGVSPVPAACRAAGHAGTPPTPGPRRWRDRVLDLLEAPASRRVRSIR